MRDFNRGSRSGDRRGGGGFNRRDSRGSFGSRDRSERPEMHKAVCAECGMNCEVPFKPTGEKPVFCSNCFQGKEGSAPRRSDSRDFDRRDSRGSFGSRDRSERPEMHKAVCAECGEDCEIPFKPTTDRPILCSSCFAGNNGGRDRKSGGSNIQLEAQIKVINDKLDMILKSLSLTPSKTLVEKSPVEKKKSIVKPTKAETKKKTTILSKVKSKVAKKSKK